MVAAIRHYLVIYNRRRGKIIRHRRYLEPDQALTARFEAEREYTDDPDIEVVVLSAESWTAVQQTHSRYFKNEQELAEFALKRRARAALYAVPGSARADDLADAPVQADDRITALMTEAWGSFDAAPEHVRRFATDPWSKPGDDEQARQRVEQWKYETIAHYIATDPAQIAKARLREEAERQRRA
jgi:hypothetical protein